MFPNLTAPIQPSYKPPPPKQTYNSPAPSKAPVYKPEPKPSYSAPQEAPHIIYAGHPPIHIYQQPPVLEQTYQVHTVLPHIIWPPKLKTNISSGSHCLESFIHREEGDVSIISVCRAAGWDRFYKLSVVESLVRMTGWLTGKKEIATIQILMTNANITRNRPQSLGRLT